MAVWLIVLIIIAILLGIGGFALHVLWIIAVILFVVWLIGLVLGRRGPRV